MRRCLTVQLQPEGAEEPQTNTSVPQHEEQADATKDKVIADYEQDVEYEPEGLGPVIKPDTREVENSDEEYA